MLYKLRKTLMPLHRIVIESYEKSYCRRSYFRPPYTQNEHFLAYLTHVPRYSSLEILLPMIF